MPEVSVIVPVYNVSCYLRKCIDSILDQTYRDYELILVDDGSTDESGSICDEYAQKDGWIRVIHKENGGLSSARNAGLKLATGEYVYFCDSDDYIDNRLLEKCVGAIPGHDMVVINHHMVDEMGRVLFTTPFQEGNHEWDSDQGLLDFLIADFFGQRIGWEAWSRLFRKSIIDRYGLYFEDNKLIFAEDKYFTLCYLLHAKSVYCLSDVLYFYLQRDSSIMAVQRKRNNTGRMNNLSIAVRKHLDGCRNLDEIKQYYPIIHMLIMREMFTRLKSDVEHNTDKYKETRKMILADTEKYSFFQEQGRGLPGCYRRYRGVVGTLQSTADVSEYMYYATGKPKYYIIRRLIGGIRRLQDIFGLGGR